MILNENNIQAPFQYKIGENTFELLKINGELELNTNNLQIKVSSGERLFCADIGYAIDGAVEEMEFLVDDIKVYPQVLDELKDLQSVEIKDNEVYLIRNELDFKSIVFFPPNDLNKNFKFTITTYSSTFSAFMLDEIAIKLNSLDINYPIKNYYESVDYEINDIIKYNGYLYRVFKEFTSDSTDYYLKTNCNLLTPFKKLELDIDYKANELIEYENNFFIVQKDFSYNQASGSLINLNGLLKPLQDIIVWFEGINKIYKNQIVIKDNILYIVLEDIENPIWENIQSQLDILIKAENTFYDDSNSSFGSNTNTVQKAIEKLKSSKQDSLISVNNISLNGNKISLIGGTSKEYILENNYFINDLIIKDEKIYKVNEDFISLDWTTDRSKLTLISSGSSGAAEAIDVSFDNSKTNLQYITGYDFPKFKYTIPDTINLVLTDASSTTDYPATITKQEDGSYVLNASMSNVQSLFGTKTIVFIIKSIENQTDKFLNYNIINIFWEISTNNEWTANSGDVSIEGIEEPIQFSFYNNGIVISKTDLSDFAQEPYNITLTIKNRHLHNLDTYFLGIGNYSNTSFLSYLNLQNNNGLVKLVGTINGIGVGLESNPTSSYSFINILSNYFNLVSQGSYINTTEITSSTGKAVKYYFMQNTSDTNAVDLVIAYQDGSTISSDDIFTLNLTPEKNAALDPIYSEVTNLQEAIESIVLNSIKPIGSVYFQIAKEDGSFDDNESPENLFGGVWELQYADEGIFLRTEGGNSNENRVDGIQGDAIRNITGKHWQLTYYSIDPSFATGSFILQKGGSLSVNQVGSNYVDGTISINASKQVPTGSEVTVINRWMRIHKRIA
ncbi:phage tail protein [Brachyspira hampsonii]|uniref:phage tail protein n=1 Tax=Brachyspira hampsonii TaxID=1287055 RepID=UPI000D35A285|nr:phage tail protein [Brachyspira hampsonii]PTY39245.1 Hvp 101 VSH-1 tail protein [Brachyspira hampsonii bv. II]